MQYPELDWGLPKWAVRAGMIFVPWLVAITLINVLGVDSSNHSAIVVFFAFGWIIFLIAFERWMERHDPSLDIAPNEDREQAFADLFDLDENQKK